MANTTYYIFIIQNIISFLWPIQPITFSLFKTLYRSCGQYNLLHFHYSKHYIVHVANTTYHIFIIQNIISFLWPIQPITLSLFKTLYRSCDQYNLLHFHYSKQYIVPVANTTYYIFIIQNNISFLWPIQPIKFSLFKTLYRSCGQYYLLHLHYSKHYIVPVANTTYYIFIIQNNISFLWPIQPITFSLFETLYRSCGQYNLLHFHYSKHYIVPVANTTYYIFIIQKIISFLWPIQPITFSLFKTLYRSCGQYNLLHFHYLKQYIVSVANTTYYIFIIQNNISFLWPIQPITFSLFKTLYRSCGQYNLSHRITLSLFKTLYRSCGQYNLSHPITLSLFKTLYRSCGQYNLLHFHYFKHYIVPVANTTYYIFIIQNIISFLWPIQPIKF